jgi:DNA polymerase III sliding clamp (beta) subunit (PCNA family)
METKEVIKTAPRYFVMSWGDYTLVEKLHDIGEFPDYTRAIPVKEPVGVFRMDAKELLSIVKQCPCPDKFTGVYLEFTESNCKVSGQDIGKEIEIVRDIPCEADVFIGTQVRLMQRYLADVLKVIGGEVVIILSDEAGLSPVKLQDADDDGRLFVIMPMRQ